MKPIIPWILLMGAIIFYFMDPSWDSKYQVAFTKSLGWGEYSQVCLRAVQKQRPHSEQSPAPVCQGIYKGKKPEYTIQWDVARSCLMDKLKHSITKETF